MIPIIIAALKAVASAAAKTASVAAKAGSTVAKGAVTAGKAVAETAGKAGSAVAQGAEAVGKGALQAGKAAGQSGIGQIDSALTQLGSQAGQLGKMGMPGSDFFTDLVSKGSSALDKVSSALGPSSAEAAGPQAAVPMQAGPPVNLAPKPAPKLNLIQQVAGLGGGSPASGGPPQANERPAEEAPGLQEIIASAAGAPVELSPRKDPLNLTEYGVEPNRYAAKNPASKWLVNTANSIPGVDLALNAGRRVVDAYLGNPKMQAAKLRILDESALAKSEASQSKSMLDLITDIWKTTAAGQQAMERQTQADEAAAGRVTTQQAGADRRAEEAQVGATTRTEMVAKQKTDADNLLVAKDIMSKWKGMTEQERFGYAPFLKSVFGDFPISDTEMNGLTWTQEQMRRVTDWWEKKFGRGSKTAGPTSAPGTPPPRGAGTKARGKDKLDNLLFGGSL